MKFGLFEILTLIGALGFFIYGMKVMSEGIQKIAGQKLRQILGAMTKNRYLGIITGFLITSLVQSSSATTVMTVSFVNAGLLTLIESIGVIMGANIGTTVTAWLISLFGFGKVSIAAISLPIISIGFPLMFLKKDSLKYTGEILIGFALLFMGLDALKHAVPDIRSNPEMLEFLANFTDHGIFSTIFFVLIGTILTIVVQSSSAAMALTLTLLFNDVITFPIAAAMVLGENIGTTITANLAALVGNVHAKRAARAHLIFNVFGVCWMILLFPIFIDLVEYLWATVNRFFASINPELSKSTEELQLSLFHTLFNIINVSVLIWFVSFIARTVERMVKPKNDDDEVFRLDYIETGLLGTPELAILEAKKEVAKFGKTTARMSSYVQKLLFEQEDKKQEKYLDKIKKYEEITDRVEEEVTSFLTQVSQGEVSENSSIRIRSMIAVTNDLERIGDVFYQMSLDLKKKIADKVWFTPDQRENLKGLFEKLDEAFVVMVSNLEMDFEKIDLTKAKEIEREINVLRNKLRKSHLKQMEAGKYGVRNGMIYNNLFNSCERVGDHVINVSEALAGEI